MYGAALSRAQPTAFISQDLSDFYTAEDDLEQQEEGAEAVEGQLRNVAGGYEAVPFPQLGYTFSGVVIHWLKGTSPAPA